MKRSANATVTRPVASFAVSYNEDHDGIEIRGEGKPADKVRRSLKEAGFRFTVSNDDPRWYGASTVENTELLHEWGFAVPWDASDYDDADTTDDDEVVEDEVSNDEDDTSDIDEALKARLRRLKKDDLIALILGS